MHILKDTDNRDHTLTVRHKRCPALQATPDLMDMTHATAGLLTYGSLPLILLPGGMCLKYTPVAYEPWLAVYSCGNSAGLPPASLFGSKRNLIPIKGPLHRGEV